MKKICIVAIMALAGVVSTLAYVAPVDSYSAPTHEPPASTPTPPVEFDLGPYIVLGFAWDGAIDTLAEGTPVEIVAASDTISRLVAFDQMIAVRWGNVLDGDLTVGQFTTIVNGEVADAFARYLTAR